MTPKPACTFTVLALALAVAVGATPAAAQSPSEIEAALKIVKEEKLKALPHVSYKAYRMQTGIVSPTGFISFETNRYSVPSRYSHQPVSMMIYPRHIEIVIQNRPIATHQRSFLKNRKSRTPSIGKS